MECANAPAITRMGYEAVAGGRLIRYLLCPFFPEPSMASYAVINDRGRRFRVMPGNEVWIDLNKEAPKGSKITFDQVELVGGDAGVRVGTPTLNGVQVVGLVKGSKNGKKMVVFKYKRRKNTRRHWGARSRFTRVAIESIVGA